LVPSSTFGKTSRRASRRTSNESTKSIDGWYGTPAHGANPGFRAPQAFVGIKVTLSPAAIEDQHRGYRIDRNTIADFTSAGIQVQTGPTSKRYEGLSIDGNEIYVSAEGLAGNVGIRFAPPGGGSDRWLHNAIVSGNRVSDDVLTKIERHETVPFITISGNASARQTLEGDGRPGTGSPEGIVEAPPGSMFVPVGSSPVALYLKQTGSDATGWVKVTTESP
jgi:hypothetical protein